MTRRLAGLALVPVAAVMGGAAPPASGADVTVSISDIRNARGVVRACMTGNEKRFPKCRGDAASYSAVVDAREGGVVLTFRGVKPGRYAVALLHDENGNGKADRALGMMPKEGFGFSRDAPVRMGPPSFGDAVFEVNSQPQRLKVKMRYML